ncbi:MAG: Lead, cadmium, zinc and mercury transporting ATPase, partial [Myxococcaceae bacterium]|nr:Lead, cadmium, zinc and mercury transporting ATPase [Myxococcaceae bacterium]
MTGELTLSGDDTPGPKLDSSVRGADETSDFPVQGMTCASCVARVERALASVPGVYEARVNLATQRATVRYGAALTTPEHLTEAVRALGYQVPAGTLSSQPSSQPSAARTRSHVSPRQRALALAAAEQRAEQGLRRDLLVAAALSAPLLILAMSHGAIPHSDSALGRALQLGLATPVLFGPGLRFLKLAWKRLTQRSADMSTLVSIGALAAYGYSALAVLDPALFSRGLHGHAGPPLYFEAGAAIVTFVLLGKLLEARAKKRLSTAVSGLGELLPRTAQRLVRGEAGPSSEARFESVDVDDIARGDRLLVRAGERVPNDGQVLEGHATVDESMLTGESIPVAKTLGGAVYGGSLLVEGALTLRVTETGGDTALGRIVEAVEQ